MTTHPKSRYGPEDAEEYSNPFPSTGQSPGDPEVRPEGPIESETSSSPEKPTPSSIHRPRRPRIDPCRTPLATPYLVIRSFEADLGVRPVAAGEEVGLAYSPDIPFVPEETNDGSAIVLQCWVTNIGLAPAAPVQVEFFLMPPSITQPVPSPFLVATEYTVIQPRSSKLIRSLPLTFPNPFGGGLAEGVVVRASTPFDRSGDALDPAVDRHVAMMNAWPITDNVAPSIDFNITNWFETTASARVDVVVERLRLPRLAGAKQAVRHPFAPNALLALDAPEPDVAHQVGELQRRRTMSARHARKFRSALAGPPVKRERLALPVTGIPLGFVDTEIEITALDTRRRLFPDSRGIPFRPAQPSITKPQCGLPRGRQTALEGLELGALEERRLRLSVSRRTRVEPDEYLVVHLFHLSDDGSTFHGRLALIMGNAALLTASL